MTTSSTPMTNGSELKGKSAKALRAAGYIPLPRLWVTREQMELVSYMAHQNNEDIKRIRTEVNNDIETQKDRAWVQHNGRD